VDCAVQFNDNTTVHSYAHRSIDELDVRIANLVGKNEVSPEDKEEDKEEEEMEVDVTETDKCCMSQSQRMSRQTRVTSRAGKKGSKKPPKAAAEGTGGCFVCRVDNDYQNMLLCDSCDAECHMYCHYPRLWMVPRGRWECPLCNEVRELRVSPDSEAHQPCLYCPSQLDVGPLNPI
jgi:hypothetical protein